ncbi:acyl-homoserine-lactone acylase [Pseudoduganella flava]|uniref:Acyl-homoserine-lactone acylase n=1 Tax=Pseudoduganella flava TaxID=871742 RepID=A0A562PXB8_9BURK|nr:penicillin acylase family protein [Pseudoduganella flava]TWI48810.1 acyl-homoserine-lactone acylase [Pseudoduganella flava]
MDLVRLTRRIALTAMSWIGPIGSAPQPGTATLSRTSGRRASRAPRVSASNAIAIGADASADGRGMLLGQPHLPWGDALRFYQLHLTIPGKLDVMGATLPGLPVVGIGFTKEFAWTHTTDTSAHFTAYALQLDPSDPTHYLVDGQPRALVRRTLAVPVKNADGSTGTRTRTLFSTEYGPLVAVPGLLEWTPTTVYALRDANMDNDRVVTQWYEMNKARSLAELKEANLRVAGNPWNNTIAADRAGNTLLMNVSPIANLPDDALAGCLLPQYAPLAPEGLHVLDGSRSACAWRDEAGAPQPGTVPANRLPVLERRDFVQNANDSAWLSNPAAPLTGFPALVSRDGVPQGARTRQVLAELPERLRQHRLTLDDLRDLALNDKVYLAPLLLPDLRAWCASGPAQAEVTAGCAALSAWSGDAGFDANLGLPYFAGIMTAELPENTWGVPFDPRDPVHTPRGLNWRDDAVAAALAKALASTVQRYDAAGVPRSAKLGDFQVSRRGGAAIPIHGGLGELGILNAIDVDPNGQGGQFEVSGGTSYLQVVGFDDAGPRALALLTYSQSADPSSPHHSDQTRRFSKREWIALPFTAAEIAADPQLRKEVIVEK